MLHGGYVKCQPLVAPVTLWPRTNALLERAHEAGARRGGSRDSTLSEGNGADRSLTRHIESQQQLAQHVDASGLAPRRGESGGQLVGRREHCQMLLRLARVEFPLCLGPLRGDDCGIRCDWTGGLSLARPVRTGLLRFVHHLRR